MPGIVAADLRGLVLQVARARNQPAAGALRSGCVPVASQLAAPSAMRRGVLKPLLVVDWPVPWSVDTPILGS